VLGLVSGVGKSTLTYTDSILSRPQTIEVEVVSGDGSTVRASSVLVVNPVTPSLSIYENHPLLGFLFHKEISGTYDLSEREVAFAAFPYFFSTPNRAASLINYEWRNNAGGTENQNAVVYRTPDNSSGIAEVGVYARSQTNITQEARVDFKIQFDSTINNL
jgi:hypothetical protein